MTIPLSALTVPMSRAQQLWANANSRAFQPRSRWCPPYFSCLKAKVRPSTPTSDTQLGGGSNSSTVLPLRQMGWGSGRSIVTLCMGSRVRGRGRAAAG